jgi:hypothetical protein
LHYFLAVILYEPGPARHIRAESGLWTSTKDLKSDDIILPLLGVMYTVTHGGERGSGYSFEQG